MPIHHSSSTGNKNSTAGDLSTMAEVAKKYAVVTGANKGIGLEICRQLASQGVCVVLTARNEERGLEAVKQLQKSGLSEFVLFHQLDVTDLASIASLAEFLKSRIGKLDFLINNAGIGGALVDGDAFKAALGAARSIEGARIDWSEIMTQTYDLAAQGIETNYHGAKRTTEALVPLLRLSDSPRIVNVSAEMGKLKRVVIYGANLVFQNIQNARAKGVLDDAENLTEERIDEVVDEFLRDSREGCYEDRGWPEFFAAYIVSKAALNAYTRVLAKKYQSFRVNCVCPGFVKTDMNYNTGVLTVEEGAESPVRVALLPHDGPSGLFFVGKEVSCFNE